MSLIVTIRISRRLPTVPPVKQKTESYAEELADFDSYIDEEERKMSQLTNKSSVRDTRTTQKRYLFISHYYCPKSIPIQLTQIDFIYIEMGDSNSL